MQARINYYTLVPQAYKAVAALNQYVVRDSGLPPRLQELIKIRASIVNGCTYCVDMHIKEARHQGLGEQWINLISVWREARVYTEAERAVLAWTDALTLVAQTQAPDAEFEALQKHFSDEEITQITVAIGLINVWNRLGVGLRSQHPVDEPA